MAVKLLFAQPGTTANDRRWKNEIEMVIYNDRIGHTPGRFSCLPVRKFFSNKGADKRWPGRINGYDPRFFAISEGVLQAFQDQYHVNVRFLKSGDAGTALNKAILSKDNPLADVLYGVDNTFLSRALQEGIYEPYNAPRLKTSRNNSSWIRKIAPCLWIMGMFV